MDLISIWSNCSGFDNNEEGISACRFLTVEGSYMRVSTVIQIVLCARIMPFVKLAYLLDCV